MNIISIAGCLIIIAYSIKIVSREKEIFRFDVLMNLIISTTLLVSSFKLSALQHDFSLEFIISVFLFLILFNLNYNYWKKLSVNLHFSSDYSTKNFKCLAYILLTLIVTTFLYTWKKLGMPPGFGGKVSRSQYYIGKLEGIFILIYFLIFAVFFDRFNKRCLGRGYYLFLAVFAVLIVARANKFTMIYLIVTYYILRHYYYKKINLKDVIIIFSVVFLIFIISFTFLYNNAAHLTTKRKAEIYGMRVPEKLYFITDVYAYVAFNYENLNNYMIKSTNQSNGYYVFGALNDILGLDKTEKAKEYASYWPNELQYRSLTTGTLLRDYFVDFSYLGILMAAFFIGFLSGLSHVLYYQFPKNLFTNFFYSLMLFGTIMSFFTNFYSDIIFWANIGVAIMFTLIVKENRITNDDNNA